ncbi:MAG: ABC transporter ATP-binding protein [Desulfovibrio sp.]
MFLEVDNLCQQYGGKAVLKNLSFQMAEGEILSVVGPSGAGKTTLLKAIASLEAPSSGRINFSPSGGGEQHKEGSYSGQNPILVFQDYILFPHLTVFDNVAFGLQCRKVSSQEIKKRVLEIIEHFGLSGLSYRYPAQLSGGQQQRVSIARAMVVKPPLLLLDEPFANLDRNLKGSTARFIRETQKYFNVPTICVTHDLEEAFAIADRVVILMDGELVQIGVPADVYRQPCSLPVASFLGPVNVLPSKYAERLGIKGTGDIYFRPESAELDVESGECSVVFESMEFMGHYFHLKVLLDDNLVSVYSSNNYSEIGLTHGDVMYLRVNSPIVFR